MSKGKRRKQRIGRQTKVKINKATVLKNYEGGDMRQTANPDSKMMTIGVAIALGVNGAPVDQASAEDKVKAGLISVLCYGKDDEVEFDADQIEFIRRESGRWNGQMLHFRLNEFFDNVKHVDTMDAETEARIAAEVAERMAAAEAKAGENGDGEPAETVAAE